MLKILFTILKLFPQGLALIQQYNAAESAKLEKQVADYRLKSLSDAAEIEKLQGVVRDWRKKADLLTAEIQIIETTVRERNAEIERLQNETQQRLKAVDSMDSESVFNAIVIGGTPSKLPVNRIGARVYTDAEGHDRRTRPTD